MSQENFNFIVNRLMQAQSILLTTHKQCDGDGLGALLGLYHGLKKMGKNVRAFTVDEIPKKYNFLSPHRYIDIFEKPHKPLEEIEVALVFDTNDSRLVEPFYSHLVDHSKDVFFIDHHPLLVNQRQHPTEGSYINTNAASTGEISFKLIEALGIELDGDIARALYTSIVFDTQLFRYIRKSPESHLICAELLKYEKNPETVHESLFATYSPSKISFLAQMFNSLEYFGANGEIALLKVSKEDLNKKNLDMDDSRDLIDMIMNIQTVKLAALFREESPHGYKISLRSRGETSILGVAESFGGGGHKNASGALIQGSYEEIKKNVLEKLLNLALPPAQNNQNN